MEKVIPKRVKIVAPHFKFLPTSNSHLEYLFFPIQTKLVLSVFIVKPDTDPKISKTFNAASRDCLLPSNIKVVSSANCVILNSFPLIFIPFKVG